MLHIAMSNGCMDWHKYPKSTISIRIQQPEGLGSKNCHTFPGLGVQTLNILLHESTLQFFFARNVLIEMPAHTNSFSVYRPGLCMPHEPAGLRLACIHPSQLYAWQNLTAALGQYHWLRQAGGLLAQARLSAYPVWAQYIWNPDHSDLESCQLHSHQPPIKSLALSPGRTVNIYSNCETFCINAASTVVKAARSYA
jgi:hypothetical protein